MSAGLLAVAVAFHFIPVNTDTLALETTKISSPAIVVLVFIIWFVFFYGVSVGNTAWMVSSLSLLNLPTQANILSSPPISSPWKSAPWEPCG
jgi:hypothetical protein